jgi:hypothetical protein
MKSSLCGDHPIGIPSIDKRIFNHSMALTPLFIWLERVLRRADGLPLESSAFVIVASTAQS